MDNYKLIPVWDIISHLNQLIGKTEEVRSKLAEGSSILRRQIYEKGPAEWLKGESPRCKREHAMSCDESKYRTTRINHLAFKTQSQGFPGGSEIKNLPVIARDIGSIPSPGRSHMSRRN